MSPDVSVIIPCRNEVQFIDTCLESISKQLLQEKTIEIIVADGISHDGTRTKLTAWAKRNPHIKIVDNPRYIVPTGLNLAIAQAVAPVIVRMDVHSHYPPDYVRTCLGTLEQIEADNVGGVVITQPHGDSLSARIVQAVSTHPFGVGGAKFRLQTRGGYVDTVPFGCFRREIFDRIGYFDERLVRNQDYEFNKRITSSGGKIWLNPSIQIKYFNQNKLRGLFRQAWLTGKWNTWTWWVAPYAFAWRHLVPGLFVLFLAIGFILCVTLTWFSLIYYLTLILYFILALISAVQQSMRYHNFGFIPLLPFIFLGYHMSYGLGILQGGIQLLCNRSPVS